mmetsp:Transcript_13645/g.22719  ORF Transcript_13645/g.22719 Transcript_13645/m.22719 type:complete len:114 (+) Transcript_13645:1-342(+)
MMMMMMMIRGTVVGRFYSLWVRESLEIFFEGEASYREKEWRYWKIWVTFWIEHAFLNLQSVEGRRTPQLSSERTQLGPLNSVCTRVGIPTTGRNSYRSVLIITPFFHLRGSFF